MTNRISITNKSNSSEYEISLDIYTYEKDKLFFAYCPSLDLITCTKQKNDIDNAFQECLQSYLDYCIENGTLHDDLVAHGWKLSPEKISQPSLSKIIKNKEFRQLFDSQIGFQRSITTAMIPAL